MVLNGPLGNLLLKLLASNLLRSIIQHAKKPHYRQLIRSGGDFQLPFVDDELPTFALPSTLLALISPPSFGGIPSPEAAESTIHHSIIYERLTLLFPPDDEFVQERRRGALWVFLSACLSVTFVCFYPDSFLSCGAFPSGFLPLRFHSQLFDEFNGR